MEEKEYERWLRAMAEDVEDEEEDDDEDDDDEDEDDVE